MGISLYNIKRWSRMLAGRSIYHVDQNIGKAFIPGELAGYFNDLTQKVLQGDANMEKDIPFLEHSDGSHVQMPTMVFQYGLGAYDLWLLSEKKDESFLQKAKTCAEWAIAHQQTNGSWSNFVYIYSDNPYSAMSQGEGASLLLRIYQATNDAQMLIAAKTALDYMLIDAAAGGVSRHEGDDLYLLEYTHLPLVLNGWIFALFGLYDMILVQDDERYQAAYAATLKTMVKALPAFDCGYWSLYDKSGKITSPFYHKLHVAQMQALYQATGNVVFQQYADMFACYQGSLFKKTRAFVKKSWQKIVEK